MRTKVRNEHAKMDPFLSILSGRASLDKMALLLTPSLVHSLRETNLLALPKSVQNVIASLQLAPVMQGFVKKPKFNAPYKNNRPAPPVARSESSDNWRDVAATQVRRRMNEVDDIDYAEVCAMLNKISKMNYDKLSAQIIEILKKREADGVFRLRVVTLIFSKGTEDAMFAPVFGKLAVDLKNLYLEVIGDLKSVCNIDTWHALYAEETVVLPGADHPDFDDIAIKWTKQKNRRRGYSRFMIELYLLDLIEANVVNSAVNTTLDDLKESIQSVRTPMMEEYVNQLCTFVYDTSKLLKGKPITKHIKVLIAEIVANVKNYTCLPMRSKFKLEDTAKLL